MKKSINLYHLLALAFFFLFSLSDNLFAQRPALGDQNRRVFAQQPGGFWSKLTDEQKQTLRQKIDKLRDQGARRKEIHAAVIELLTRWGIQPLEHPGEGMRRGPRARDENDIFVQLTKEQRQALHDKIAELREQLCTPDEIHQAIKELLRSWGYTVPENFDELGHGRFGPQRNPLFDQLSEEQRQAIKSKIEALHSQNATREEIAAAVADLLQSWGITVPDDFAEKFGRFPRPGHEIFAQLTEEQRKEVHDKIQELRSQGKSQEETAALVAEMLTNWGVDVPDGFIENFSAQRRGMFLLHIWSQLTEEQKQAIKDKREEMKNAGATSQEIREAIRKMLKEFGFDLPDRRQRPDLDRTGNGNEEQGKTDSRQTIQARNFPNPFNPETTIHYTLPNPEFVTLKFYNLQGQLIRTLVNEQQAAGDYSVIWDGTNDAGEKAVSGMYFYHLNVGKETISEKMLLMR